MHVVLYTIRSQPAFHVVVVETLQLFIVDRACDDHSTERRVGRERWTFAPAPPLPPPPFRGTRYDTIRDAILTCARKPTRVGLLYRTEPTTKKCKNRKTKSRKQVCSEITVSSLGNPCSESGRIGKTAVAGICRKGRF